MKKLTSVEYEIDKNNEITVGASFGNIVLNVSLQRLLDVFGQPTVIGSGDNKVQLEWVFYDEETKSKIFTIYDWKTNTPIHKINEWHIGRKSIDREEVHSTLVKMGLTRGDEIVYVD